MAAVEKARAATEAQLEAAQTLPAAYLREIFPQPGQTLLLGWRWVKLGEVCEFIRGVNFDKALMRTSPSHDFLPILRAGNISESLDLVNDLIWVPESFVSAEQRLRTADIIICISSGSPTVVGKTAQLKKPWLGSVGAFCGIIRAYERNTADWLGLWFRSAGFISWRNEQARGANIQNLRFSQFADIMIPLPHLLEQKRIAAMLTEKISLAEKIINKLQEQIETINKMPAALLRKAFNGEL